GAEAALSALEDEPVGEALGIASDLVGDRAASILSANGADVEAATGALDEGALDRLRLDERRVDAIAAQLRELADLPPLERDVGEWTLENGLRVRERRIPVGVVGANFEARPNVAVDLAGQLL